MNEYPWYMSLFNADLIEQKNKQWQKEAEEKGMTLEAYLDSLKNSCFCVETVSKNKGGGE